MESTQEFARPYSETLQAVGDVIERIDEYCLKDSEKANQISALMKELYDHSSARGTRSFGPLDSLVVDDLDSESIWEELRGRNAPLTKYLKKRSTALLQILSELRQHSNEGEGGRGKRRNKGKQELHSNEIDSKDGDSGVSDRDSDSDDASRTTDASGSSDDYEYTYGDVDEDARGLASDEDDSQEPEEEEDLSSDTGDYDSEGMEAWLDEAEELDQKHREKLEHLESRLAHAGAVEDGDTDASETDEMFVQRAMMGEVSDSDDGSDGGEAAKFSDFFEFDSSVDKRRKTSKKRGSESVSLRKKQEEVDSEKSSDDFEFPEAASEGEESENDDGVDGNYESGSQEDEEEEDEVSAAPLTGHAKRQVRKNDQIAEIEADLMGDKSWELRGEVSAADRQENSLLEINPEIERASKPAPLVTQEHTSSLEELIIKRITDFNFDDVVVPDSDVATAQTDEETQLSQEKSRLGLGEIYANEFLAQTSNGEGDEKESELHTEIKGLFHKVSRSLDALSHFHYTPRPVVSDARIAVDVPTLSMEEATPAINNTAAGSAPEEIHAKKRGRESALLAGAELTSADRKRLRQASKATRNKARKETNYKEQALSLTGKASSKYEAQKTEAILRSDRRVTSGVNSTDGTSYAKSGQFFEKLQAQAQADIRSGGKSKKVDSSKAVSNKKGSSAKYKT